MPLTHIGDRGQRYEVKAIIDGKLTSVGWTQKADGGGLVEIVNLHPSWHSPIVIDREAAND